MPIIFELLEQFLLRFFGYFFVVLFLFFGEVFLLGCTEFGPANFVECTPLFFCRSNSPLCSILNLASFSRCCLLTCTSSLSLFSGFQAKAYPITGLPRPLPYFLRTVRPWNSGVSSSLIGVSTL
uniref:Rep B n=1 Tax=Lactobacillus acidophilus TaxID=1579 RepID=Q48512_LACAI|nr:Rep B [Lactobacillus acidophilus]